MRNASRSQLFCMHVLRSLGTSVKETEAVPNRATLAENVCVCVLLKELACFFQRRGESKWSGLLHVQ